MLTTALILVTLCAAPPAAPPKPASPAPPKVSGDSKDCIRCHETATPGLVGDWRRSRHAQVTPRQALAKPALERRVSIQKPPDDAADVVVGCAECHTMSPETHKDTFDHNGFDVHVVVTPRDCARCHPEEVTQYDQNIMARAYDNLMANPLYHSLVDEVNGVPTVGKDGRVTVAKADTLTNDSACLACHGSKVEVTGTTTRETSAGEMTFPVLSGWPNDGVGRLNPDGSRGSCGSCHARHQFSLEVARKPGACEGCHSGPDVPAYPVWVASKHGGITEALEHTWNFDAVPWVPGRDYTAPTCAACHVSLVTEADGTVLSPRTHRMNDRLPWRLFGLPYAHPHPASPDTTTLKNKLGLPLPTELTGEPVAQGLISAAEVTTRKEAFKQVCRPCHAREWVDGHFSRLERTMETTNASTLAATKLVLRAWELGLAKGPLQKASAFDEPIERLWAESWLFYGNSTRFAAAMGNADYGVFAGGRWQQSKNVREMAQWLEHAERERRRK